MTNPVLVEVLRGAIVESAHRGAVAVFDGDGKPVLEIGDTAQAGVSALRGQGDPGAAAGRNAALPMPTASATANWRWPAPRIPASRRMSNWRRRCWPRPGSTSRRSNAARIGRPAMTRRIALARAGGSPNALHNNCSGKHSGFLCTCVHAGIAHQRLRQGRPCLSGDGARRHAGGDRRCPRCR